MNQNTKDAIILAALLTILISLYIIFVGFKTDSPAPGCVKYWPGIFRFAGGCNAKYTIADIKIEPSISCLNFDLNNCNIPTLQLQNSCNESVYINENKISRTYWLVANMPSELLNTGPGGNMAFVGFMQSPGEDKHYTLNGVVGDKKFAIRFTVTKALC